MYSRCRTFAPIICKWFVTGHRPKWASSSHLNAHNIKSRSVMDGDAQGDAAKLNLIASHGMSKTYSVRGNRAIRSQQGPVTCSQVKRAITSAATLCYDPVATLWLQVCPCPKRECLRTLNYSSSSWRCWVECELTPRWGRVSLWSCCDRYLDNNHGRTK